MANRHGPGLHARATNHALRLLAEGTRDDVLHEENSAPGPGGLSLDFLVYRYKLKILKKLCHLVDRLNLRSKFLLTDIANRNIIIAICDI